LQELIQQMIDNPDTISEVLVEPEGIDWDQTANQPGETVPGPESEGQADSLLELFRTGPTLSKAQFLLELEKHELLPTPVETVEITASESIVYHRREPRISVSLPVQVTAQDLQEPSPHATHLIDVSHRGARVGGIAYHLKPGEVVNLVSDGCDARFLVIWIGEPGTPQEGQIGLQSLATAD
jgi:hypothetical protein